MTDVDVTVIVPVFNTMPYLTRTLESLAEQTIGPDRMHVVAVDDGSDDGSAEELERYAAAYPGLFTVVHQANSGGPAGPCNVGLDLAEGRYVYFLGADDHLGLEALERMVDRADQWGSDVLCGRMVGTDERFVGQRLYREDREEIAFPDRALVFALSNTKLFRRALIEEHGIRYALDLKVGSDQPFTIEAMLHAKRISVLADYEYYYAVKRHNASNISYSSTWSQRLADIGTIMGHVADLVGPGDLRDAILLRHFASELAKLLQRDFPELPEAEQAELVAGLRVLAERYYTDRIDEGIPVRARLGFRHVLAGRTEELRVLGSVEDADQQLYLDGRHVEACYPGRGDGVLGADAFRVPPEGVRRAVFDLVRGQGVLEWREDRLHLALPTRLHPDSAPYVRAALVVMDKPVARPAVRRPRRAASERPSRRVEIAPDGTLTWSGDVVAELGDRDAVTWELRLQLDVDDDTFALPVPGNPLPSRSVRRRLRKYTVDVRVDEESRVIVSCAKG